MQNIDTDLKVYDISEGDNLALLYNYCEQYSVPEEDTGMVPIVFVGDQYMFGEDDIKENLEDVILNNDIPTRLLDESSNSDLSNLKAVNIFSVFAAGIINGSNPCSLSMLLFLLTLILANQNRVLQYGFSFLIGKFVAFFLFGTILFNILNKINFESISLIFNLILVIFAVGFMAVNLYDFQKARKKKYDQMVLMLPKSFIKNNHKLMKVIDFNKSAVVVSLVCVGMGVLIACGEFLCTGQVYLATIITMIQVDSQFSLQAVLYLLIYDIGFILPLTAVIIIIHRLKTVQTMSKLLVDKMHIIKLVNSILFLIFAILYLVLQ
jgi:cytochrome c biogenesis protein CcdA